MVKHVVVTPRRTRGWRKRRIIGANIPKKFHFDTFVVRNRGRITFHVHKSAYDKELALKREFVTCFHFFLSAENPFRTRALPSGKTYLLVLNLLSWKRPVCDNVSIILDRPSRTISLKTSLNWRNCYFPRTNYMFTLRTSPVLINNVFKLRHSFIRQFLQTMKMEGR